MDPMVALLYLLRRKYKDIEIEFEESGAVQVFAELKTVKVIDGISFTHRGFRDLGGDIEAALTKLWELAN